MNYPKQFIQKTNQYSDLEKFVPAPYIRKTFEILALPESAQILICGLGFYELYLNGENITKGLMAPYISNPDELLYYDKYDVRQLLQIGKNVIAIVLGNGFLNNPGGEIWEFTKAEYRDAPKVALRLDIDSKPYLETDESFVCADSPIIFDDYRLGEHYDARKEIEGWNTVNFDDSHWEKAKIAICPKGEAVLCNAEPLRIEKELLPITYYRSGVGWIYKFSENNAGVCRLKLKGYSGQKITLTYGEVLDENGINLTNISFGENSSSWMHKDIYICKGSGIEVYSPRFTYHGFQYVYVEGIEEGQATADLLTYLIIHSDIENAGQFECSDAILNKIQENVRRSDISNFHYFPTDCPQREKNGWTGDIALSAEQIMLNYSAEKSFCEWLKNLRYSQKDSGKILSIVPTSGWGDYSGPPWDAALVQVAYHVYKYTGDKNVLKDNIDAIRKYLHFAEKQKNEKGLFTYGFPDWVQPGRPCNQPTTWFEITDSLTILDWCTKTLRIMQVLEDYTDYDFVQKLAENTRNNFREVYIENGELKAPNDTQTAISMAIYQGVFNADEIATAVKQLVRKIKENDDHFDVGVIGSRFLYRVLAEYGYEDLAYKMITQNTYPSYANQVLSGATTLWEVFVDIDENGKPRKGRFSSLNHHFWGDISAWFYKYVCGININPKLQDPYTIEISPKFIKSLDYAKAERKYMGETISVEWRRINGQIEVDIKVPSKFHVIKNY